MTQEKLILLCEDSMEGIFTAVYDGWREAGVREVEVCVGEPEGLELFSTERRISADSTKSGRVLHTIRTKLGMTVYENLCCAAVSTESDKGTAIFHVLYRALGGGRCNRGIMEELADPYVGRVAALKTCVWRELHHYYGFLRFREVGGGLLVSEITPRNDILEMLEPHFHNRMPNESWAIYDLNRRKALVHPLGRDSCLMRDVDLRIPLGGKLDAQGKYEELWRAFCEGTTIRERSNQKLQYQLLPLRYRRNMVEFQ